jgi:hypothetical protein
MRQRALTLGVVMQRRETRNRWQSEAWEPWGVVTGLGGAAPPRLLVDQPGLQQWLYTGFALALHRDEAEGYYLNVSSDAPKVFVLWRMDGDQAVPVRLTASYNEASRWLDGGHSVDAVPMPPEVFAWTGEFVEANYRPEPRRRVRPRSFMHPRDRDAP